MMDLRRTTVKIYHGVKGEPNTVYLGTGVIIQPEFVITAKHVLTDRTGKEVKHQQIFIESSYGAFSDGGPQSIQLPCCHPEADFALLRLHGRAVADSCAWLAEDDAPLAEGLEVTLCGSRGAGVEKLKARISNYAGVWDLNVIDQSVFPGFSGGPVFFGQRLVGLIVRDDQRRTYTLPIKRMREFIQQHVSLSEFYHSLQPICDADVTWLKRLLARIEIPKDVAEFVFSRVAANSPFSLAVPGARLFDQHLDWLSKMDNRAGDSPFLVYLGACGIRTRFNKKLQPDARAQLEQWISATAERIGISATTLHERIAVILEPTPAAGHAVLFIKVEPQRDQVYPAYLIDVWVGSGDPLDECRHDQVTVAALGDVVRQAIDTAYRLRRRDGTRDVAPFWVEFILPLELFGWNPNQVCLPGDLTLSERHPVVLRSWERHYEWPDMSTTDDADPYAWLERCASLPEHKFMEHHVCCVSDDTELEALKKQLCDEVWALIAPCPRCGIHGLVYDTLLAALHAGLPYILWPMVPDLDQPPIIAWLCAHEYQHYPERMHRKRQNRESAWRDLALLWDDPSEDLPISNPLRQPT